MVRQAVQLQHYVQASGAMTLIVFERLFRARCPRYNVTYEVTINLTEFELPFMMLLPVVRSITYKSSPGWTCFPTS